MGTKPIMRDSYIGGIGNASFIPDDTEYHPNQLITTEEEPSTGNDVIIKRQPVSAAWNNLPDTRKTGNQTDEDKMIQLTCADDVKVSNINRTEEYNIGYVGLSILPWEEFVFNPRVFNELFYVETNGRITYDPDEVNIFFHGKNVMPPSVGDISENGKSWNIVVDNIPDLKKVRTWLTERCSIFGVTLLYKEKRFGKPVRAPCLVMIDPNKGTIGDKLYTTITRAMDSLHNRRQFCVEINLNGCVERWCKRVLMTDCEVVGGKLVITNGEEYLAMEETEDKVCCVVCFPIWLLQMGIYKLHRTVVYDDFKETFDADDLFLHGTFQDASCQRQHIFTAPQENSVFRTRSAGQTDIKTLQELGSFKFVCVKRYNKPDAGEGEHVLPQIDEHKTTTFEQLVQKRKEKVITKEKKLADKGKTKSIRFIDTPKELEDGDKTERSGEQNDKETGKLTELSVGYAKENADTTSDSDSDDDNEAGLAIPVVASVLCDNDEDSYREVPHSGRMNDGGSLFSPGAHRSLVAKDSVFSGVNASLEDRGTTPTDTVFQFNKNETNGMDSESDLSESDDSGNVEDPVNISREGLLSEMLKIEKTLPAIQGEHKSKDVKDLAIEEGKKRKPKKKGKDKPGVKKALKDLMKTTKGKGEAPPSACDDRFQEASTKLKEEQLQKISGKNSSVKSNENRKTPVPDNNTASVYDKNDKAVPDSQERQTSTASNSNVQSFKVNPASSRMLDQQESSGDDDEVVEFLSHVDDEHDAALDRGSITNTFVDKRDDRTSPDGANDGTAITQNLTDTDDSSTDGDEVEMIYQASDPHPSKHNANLFLQGEDDFGFIERVDRANHVKDFCVNGVEEISMLNVQDSANKTDGEKMKRVSKSSKNDKNPNRNEMFQKTSRSNPRSKPRSGKSDNQDKAVVVPVPVVSKSLDLDMEVCDLDADAETTNFTVNTVVKSVDTELPTKFSSSVQGIPKRPKRGTRQYNSNRKYLGAAVPPKQTKGK